MNLTESQIEIQDRMEVICEDNVYALQFWRGLCDSVLTWDHIQDDDPVDKRTEYRAFNFVLVEAPLNTFFNKYKESLIPVIVNAISSWEYSNEQGAPKYKAFDIYTETACTIAFLIGGKEAVDKHIPEFRRLEWQVCQEDDAIDGGKK